MSQRRAAPQSPITDEEVLNVIHASGYPFEVELLHTFEAAGFSCAYGSHVQLAEDSWKEVDIEASCLELLGSADDPSTGTVEVVALVEAKRFHEPRRFVGFAASPQPPSEAVACMRAFLEAGVPRMIHPDGTMAALFQEPDGILGSLRTLNSPPLCVQWGVITANNDGTKKLEHELHLKQSLDGLLLATQVYARQKRSLLVTQSGSSPALVFVVPALIVRTPTLYVFDARNRQLSRVPRLLLCTHVRDGAELHTQLLDVVSEAGVAEWLADCRAATAALRDAADVQLESLSMLAAAERVNAKRNPYSS